MAVTVKVIIYGADLVYDINIRDGLSRVTYGVVASINAFICTIKLLCSLKEHNGFN